MFRSRPVSLALVGLFVWVTGCTSYRQIALSEINTYEKVRVTTVVGEEETIQYPRIEGDSIRGQVRDYSRSRYYPDPVMSFALEDVRTLEGSSNDATKTAIVLVAVVGALIVGLVLIGESIEGSMM